MKKRTILKVLLWSGTTIFGLALLLAIHIYMVTRPKIDTSTRIMARIDLHQPVTDTQSATITDWLYRQKGVDHVLCNPHTAIVVFTFSPLQSNADDIAANLRMALHYPRSKRYVPTEKELQGGCPVASTSVLYKISMSIKHFIQ